MSIHEVLMEELGIAISIQANNLNENGMILQNLKPKQQVSINVRAINLTSSLIVALRIMNRGNNEQPHKPICLARWKSASKNGSSCIVNLTTNSKGEMKVPFNAFYIIEAQQENAKVNLWQISIVHQNGKHYIRIQKIHYFNVYKQANPRKKNRWLTLILNEKFKEYWGIFNLYVIQLFKAHQLPEYDNQDESIFIPPHDDLSNNQARIIWWNESKGLGQAITSDNQIYSIRFKDCLPWENPNDFITFYENQIIEFNGIKGPRLLNVLPIAPA